MRKSRLPPSGTSSTMPDAQDWVQSNVVGMWAPGAHDTTTTINGLRWTLNDQ